MPSVQFRRVPHWVERVWSCFITCAIARAGSKFYGVDLMGFAIQLFDISGLVLVIPERFGDSRGWFSETYQAERFKAAGIDSDFLQDNHSMSAAKGTLRGLHYQSPPFAQAKLVRVLKGAILDVAVDVRSGSPSYGRWVSAELSAENGHQLFVPRGFLHGFLTLTSDTEIAYKVDNYYSKACDGAVRWNDPDLAINWGIASDAAILSDKDREAPAFRDFKSPF